MLFCYAANLVDNTNVPRQSADDGVVEPPDLFNSVRITHIKSVTATVNEEMETIAMKAALAAVQARRIKSKKTLHHRRAIYQMTWDMAIQGIPSPQAINNNFYGNHL